MNNNFKWSVLYFTWIHQTLLRETIFILCSNYLQPKAQARISWSGAFQTYEIGNYIPMFITAQYTIAMIWSHPICTPTHDQIKKMWYIHTTEYYSDIKKNAIRSLTTKQIHFVGNGNIMLGEIN